MKNKRIKRINCLLQVHFFMQYAHCLPGCDVISFEIKGYLHYKSIFCHKIALVVELIHFLFERKIMFCSRDV